VNYDVVPARTTKHFAFLLGN